MIVNEVKISFPNPNEPKPPLAYASVLLEDCFVVKELRIVRGKNGRPFVCMPGKRIQDKCPRCNCSNHLKAKYCNECGLRLNEWRNKCTACDRGYVKDNEGRIIDDCLKCDGFGFVRPFHLDLAHPITRSFREKLTRIIINVYEAELEKHSISSVG